MIRMNSNQMLLDMVEILQKGSRNADFLGERLEVRVGKNKGLLKEIFPKVKFFYKDI